MGTKGRTSYKIAYQNAIYYLTIATVEWLDIFSRKVYKNILIDSFQYCIKNKGLVLYSYVIMSNHIHFIA
jgi:REP element-mobilizing transposase RayT